MKEMVGGCCVCSDERGWPDNPLVYCDGNGCTVAVHQACYGIVTVPTGPWYCRKCESPETKGKVRCELCPSRSGALKQTDNGGWAHVVCALYIPEVRFASVTSMEPIVLGLVPPERYNKICYICEEEGKTHRAAAGACMQCNKSGCKQQFHVTCAQSRGLLCEEAGNYLDNVKYCGYCSHHYSKLFVNFEATSVVKKKGGNVKTIPPYKPLAQDSHSSDSSGEKDGEGDAPASSAASGSATPTQAGKTKGPGRKSHGNASAKNAANASGNKNPPPPQPMDKKKSPARRGSSTGEASGSKNNTPAPSPQHSTEPPMAAKASTTPVASAKSSPNDPAPVVKAESVGVISSVSSATATAAPSTTSTSAPISTSVVQTNKTSFQESVITNTDAMDTKQTKKRKAVAAAQAAAAAAAAAASAAADLTNSPKNNDSSSSAQTWDQRDDNQEPVEKVIRRTVSEHDPTPGHFSSMTPPAPLLPPPPAHSPSTSANRHMQSPLAGPSGMNPPPSAIRSPSQHPQGRERDGQASLLVSVPLPSTSYGINLSTHQQGARVKHYRKAMLESFTLASGLDLSLDKQAQVAQASDVYKTSPSPLNPPTSNASPHIQYYQQHSQQKHVSLEQGHGLPGQSMHGHPPRNSWGGLNVQYEQQHAPQDKPGSSGMPGPSKDGGMGGPAVPATMRNKKRAAMSMANQAPPPNQLPPPSGPILATTIRTKKRAAMSTLTSMEPPPPPPPPAQMASTSTQNLASVRRGPQPTPPPLYTETVPDSPPCSPGERALKNAIKGAHTAPQMLGNELNPESMVADRLQEQLTAELAAHEAGIMKNDPLVQPPLINKASGGRSSSAQSLDQLLERQWEQGSQFLMEQAQHFDIASLLSCLHQLRTENVRLEDHVANLLQRRDHLLAVNARLAIPLAAGYVSAAPVPPPPEPPRCPRENGGQIRPPPPRSDVVTSAHQPMPDQRAHQSHQRHHREERPDERQGMRVPDVVHIAHQRPLNIDAQLTMREVQQKPS